MYQPFSDVSLAQQPEWRKHQRSILQSWLIIMRKAVSQVVNIYFTNTVHWKKKKCPKIRMSSFYVSARSRVCSCAPIKTRTDRETGPAEVTEEVRREGPSDASRWSDGGMEGGEERRGEAPNQDDKTKCLSAALKALISLYIPSAPALPPYATLDGRGDCN